MLGTRRSRKLGTQCLALKTFANPDAPWCWNIYLQNWAIFGVNVGNYSSTMEHLGNGAELDIKRSKVCCGRDCMSSWIFRSLLMKEMLYPEDGRCF